MLGFRYVCERHQQLFADSVVREGCCDPERMEKARRRLLAWLSEKYPRLVLDQFNNEACLGCAIERPRSSCAVVRRCNARRKIGDTKPSCFD